MLWINNDTTLKIFFFVGLFLLIVERLEDTFNPRQSSKKALKVFHRPFFYLLLSSYLAIVALSASLYFKTVRLSLPVSFVGVAILAVGIWFRRSAIKSLGEMWSVFIEVKNGHRIVREGIYKYLKHPYYTGAVLELIGFALLCNAYWSLMPIVAVQIPLLLIRIHYENRVLDVYGRRLRFNP